MAVLSWIDIGGCGRFAAGSGKDDGTTGWTIGAPGLKRDCTIDDIPSTPELEGGPNNPGGIPIPGGPDIGLARTTGGGKLEIISYNFANA
jgi:hypothetical protein